MDRRRTGGGALFGGLLAAAALAISGCGSSTVSNVVDPVAQAATKSTSAPGFRMTMRMNLGTAAIPGGITGSGSGAFQTHTDEGSMSMSMSLGSLGSNPVVQQLLGGSTLKIDEVLSHLTIYMKLPSALASKLSGGKPWLKLDLAKLGSASGLAGLGDLANSPTSSDPSQMLGYLRAASGQFRKLGNAEIGGIQTTGYRATIDLDKVASRFPASKRKEVQQTINTLKSEAGLSSIPVDVWIDQHHLVRRMEMAYNEHLASIGAMHLSMTMNFTDYGSQPAPTVPPASQVTDISSLAGSAASGF